MEGTKKGDKIAPSLAYVDVSALRLPMAVVYDHPADHPDAYVARIWDAIGPLMTDTIIKRDTLRELRQDIRCAWGRAVCFTRSKHPITLLIRAMSL